MTGARDDDAGGLLTLARPGCSSRPTRPGSDVENMESRWQRCRGLDTGRATRAFDDQVAWLVTHTSKTAVVEVLRVAWRTVGAIAARVVADAREARDPFDGLERIGIDEISYRRGHKYLMVVVDHDTGRLVWAKAGHDKATLQTFFDLLGPERAAKIRLISADAAEWIGEVALEALAIMLADPQARATRTEVFAQPIATIGRPADYCG